MLFDFGWSEIMLISVVALVAIGPKDLPRAMRAISYWVRKARSLSQEFQGHLDEMMREAELSDIRDDLKKATQFDLEEHVEKTIDPEGSLRESLTLPSPDGAGTTKEGAEHGAQEAPGHDAQEVTAGTAGAGPEPAVHEGPEEVAHEGPEAAAQNGPGPGAQEAPEHAPQEPSGDNSQEAAEDVAHKGPKRRARKARGAPRPTAQAAEEKLAAAPGEPSKPVIAADNETASAKH